MRNNVYDDKKFFDGYIDLRAEEYNYNDNIEQPAIFDLLSSVSGKTVLDLGCGYGALAVKLADMGAKKVVGLDVSKNMLSKAIKENPRDNIEYALKPMQNVGELKDKFDVVVSCLAIHYVPDIDALFKDVGSVMVSGGELIFSVEHPIATAPIGKRKWVGDEGFVMGFYAREGVREVEWLGTNVKKYHRKFESIVNAVINGGFILQKVVEPKPSEKMLKNVPKTAREIHRPSFLIIKAKKA